MALPFLGFFPSSSSSPPPSLLQPHPSPPVPTRPPLPLSCPPPATPPTAVPARGRTLPPFPFHVFPSGAHQWYFSTSPLNCSSSSRSAVVATVEAEEQQQIPGGSRTRLIAQNIPWTYTAEDVRSVFDKHGVVDDVELSMHSSTRNRGLAFITMGSEEEAMEALNNLNLHELDGRIIRVEFARTLKKKPPPVAEPVTKYNVFVGNLTWRVRSRDLRELFGAFNPNVLSAEVIFQTNPRRSAGYGFVSFATKEEAEAAVAALSGKRLLGRAIRLVLGKKENGRSKEELDEATELDGKSDEVNGNAKTSDDVDSAKS